MNCPHCGAVHDPETSGRFCNSCGLSVKEYATPTSSKDKEEEVVVKTVRCRFCGVPTPPPTCVACGNKVPYPDDWEEPPEE